MLNANFTEPDFCKSLVKPTGPRSNRRDAFKKWLQIEAIKLQPEQTLVVDSWTRLQDAFDEQKELEPVTTKTGEIVVFDFWACKQDYAKEILNTLSDLRCHIVVTFHEVELTDETGKILNGRVIPLMQGKFCQKYSSMESRKI